MQNSGRERQATTNKVKFRIRKVVRIRIQCWTVFWLRMRMCREVMGTMWIIIKYWTVKSNLVGGIMKIWTKNWWHQEIKIRSHCKSYKMSRIFTWRPRGIMRTKTFNLRKRNHRLRVRVLSSRIEINRRQRGWKIFWSWRVLEIL